jgi:MarR family transcriptional regulator, temperature-dependent positive regulator of motility
MPGYRLERSPAYLLHQVALLGDAIFERWEARGVTMRQLAVLTAVAEHDGVNLMTITQRTGIDRSTMTEIVGRLGRRGLLYKRRSRSDMRSFVLRITDEGRHVLNIAEPKANAVGALLLFAIPEKHQAAFVGCLESLVTAGGAHR